MKKIVVTVFALLYFGFAKAQFSGGNNAGYNSSSINSFVSLNICTVTGINNLKDYHVTFKFYPNPTQGILHGKSNEAGEIRLVNLIGVEVYKTNITTERFEIDMNGFAKGIYFAEFIGNSKTKNSQKIIKE
jgi:hypothetical protein